jgi:hypothetical protein
MHIDPSAASRSNAPNPYVNRKAPSLISKCKIFGESAIRTIAYRFRQMLRCMITIIPEHNGGKACISVDELLQARNDMTSPCIAAQQQGAADIGE